MNVIHTYRQNLKEIATEGEILISLWRMAHRSDYIPRFGIEHYKLTITEIWVQLDVLYRTYGINYNPDIRFRYLEDYYFHEIDAMNFEFSVSYDPDDELSKIKCVTTALLSQLYGKPCYFLIPQE
jgi:hypothetical protein